MEELTQYEKQLLKISFSNNKALLEIDDKILKNEKIINDIEKLIELEVSDQNINTDTILMSISGIITLMVLKVININEEDYRILLAFLISTFSIYGYINYKEKKDEINLKKSLLEDNQEELNIFTRTKLKDLKREKDVLIKIRKSIMNREEEIRNILEQKTKIKEK